MLIFQLIEEISCQTSFPERSPEDCVDAIAAHLPFLHYAESKISYFAHPQTHGRDFSQSSNTHIVVQEKTTISLYQAAQPTIEQVFDREITGVLVED